MPQEHANTQIYARFGDIGLQSQLLKSLNQGHNEFKAHVFMKTFSEFESGL